MEQLLLGIRYLREHPLVGLAAGAVLVALYFLVLRKPRFQRDAERQLAELARRRAGHYDKLRPPD